VACLFLLLPLRGETTHVAVAAFAPVRPGRDISSAPTRIATCSIPLVRRLVDAGTNPLRPSSALRIALPSTTSIPEGVFPSYDQAGAEVLRGASASAAASEAYTTTASSSSLLLLAAAEESWRQYVPLAVIALVLLDIVLGSPFANSILSLAKPPEEERLPLGGDDVEGSVADEAATAEQRQGSSPFSNLFQQSKQQPQQRATARQRQKRRERMDVDQFAKQALEKAEGVTELRDYLERWV